MPNTPASDPRIPLSTEEQLQLLRAGYEQCTNAIVISDHTGAIVYTNPHFTASTGYTLEEVYGRNPRLLKSGIQEPAYYGEMWANLKSGKSWRGKFHNRRKDGSVFWEWATISPIFAPDGTLTHYIAIKEDITAREELEQQLLEARNSAETANVAKSEFLANMSHEIRTPLNAILGMAELLEGDPRSAEAPELIATIRSSGEALLSLINDILDFSKIEVGGMELERIPFNLRELVDDSLNIVARFAAQKRIALHFHMASDVPLRVVGDPGRLRQILINLLHNAVKFTETGSVSLAVSTANGNPQRTLHLAVVDTGIGIPPDKLGNLFQSFTQADASITRRYGGTGLGLAVSHRLASLMGGTISVKSTPGAGSSFVLEIPLLLPKAEQKSTPDKKPSAPAPRTQATILIAEDNPVNQRLLALTVKKLGYDADLAADGCEALSLAASRAYDILLVDIQMPRMDGLELAREIRCRSTPSERPYLVALTANALSGDRERCLEAGFDAYLAKPVRASLLAETLEKGVVQMNVRRANLC